MKRIHIVLFLAMSGLVSCISNDVVLNEEETLTDLRINGSVVQTPTKAGDGGFVAGDAVGVYAVNYSGNTPGELRSSGNQVDNVRYVLGDGAWTPSAKASFKDRKTHADIFGYYPYDKNLSEVSGYRFEVSANQNEWLPESKMSGYEASDFLWACSTDVTPTSGIVDLAFKHRMASVSITLAEGTGWGEGEWAAAGKSVLVDDVTRSAVIDLQSGSVVPSGQVPGTSTVPQNGDGDSWRAIVVPQTVVSGKSILTVTVDGKVKHLVKDVDCTYYAGKMNSIALSINKESEAEGISISILSEGILAWEEDDRTHNAVNQEYIVVNCEHHGSLEDIIRQEGYDLGKIKNLKIIGELDDSDFRLMREQMPVLASVNLYESFMFSAYDRTDVIPASAFADKTSLTKVILPKTLKSIDSYAFSNTSLMGSLTIPEGVVSIGWCAFQKDGSLTEVKLPSTLESIDYAAFNACGSLSSLSLPDNLKKIDDFAFSSCSNISGQLVLPETLEVLGDYAFQSGESLRGSLRIPESVRVIGDGAFAFCGFDGTLSLNKGLISVGSGAFRSCHFGGELILPEGLKHVEESAFSWNDFSSVVFPSTISNIGQSAFSYNSIRGTVIIPEGIVSINSSIFEGCTRIESLVLPESLEYIGAKAFYDCWDIYSIVSNAITPPYVGEEAFVGVPKDNFTIEVPESAVAAYANEIGWRDFKRFSAFKDFSLNKRTCRFLNNEGSVKVNVRAPSDAVWEFTDIPDWISVTPSTGTGKEVVELKVSSLPRGTGNREGKILCHLNGSSYSHAISVEQYDCEYSDGDVIESLTHSKGNGVKLVFMGDCYDANDIVNGKYLSDINQAIDHFFAIEPYASYKDYFDVYTCVGVSEDSGLGTVNLIKTSRFGTQYTTSQGLLTNLDDCQELARKAIKTTDLSGSLICMVLNTNEYEGKTFLYSDDSAISLLTISSRPFPYDFRGVVQHEAGGHGFGKLGDECIDHNTFVQSCRCGCCMHMPEFEGFKSFGWYDNLSSTGDFHAVPWSHLMYDPQYSDYVDVFEGGFYHSRGVFRSEANSCMNNYVPYYSAISRESIVKRILKAAGETYSFEDFKSKDIGGAVSTKSFDLSRSGYLYSRPFGETPVLISE